MKILTTAQRTPGVPSEAEVDLQGTTTPQDPKPTCPKSSSAAAPLSASGRTGLDLQLTARFTGADLSADETLAQALGIIRKMLGASGAALLWLDPADVDRAVIRPLDEEQGWGTERRVALGEGRLVQVIRAGKSLLYELRTGDLSAEGWIVELAGRRVNAVLCSPLAAGEECLWAVLLFGKAQGRFAGREAERLGALAGRLAGQQVAQDRQLRRLEAVVAELEVRRRELLHSRDTLRALFDSVPTSMYIVDRQYRLAAINRSRAALAGQAPRELVSRRCFEALFQRKNACPDCRVEETFSLGSRTQRLERRAANG